MVPKAMTQDFVRKLHARLEQSGGITFEGATLDPVLITNLDLKTNLRPSVRENKTESATVKGPKGRQVFELEMIDVAGPSRPSADLGACRARSPSSPPSGRLRGGGLGCSAKLHAHPLVAPSLNREPAPGQPGVRGRVVATLDRRGPDGEVEDGHLPI